jgi:hypothetical protein
MNKFERKNLVGPVIALVKCSPRIVIEPFRLSLDTLGLECFEGIGEDVNLQ